MVGIIVDVIVGVIVDVGVRARSGNRVVIGIDVDDWLDNGELSGVVRIPTSATPIPPIMRPIILKIIKMFTIYCLLTFEGDNCVYLSYLIVKIRKDISFRLDEELIQSPRQSWWYIYMTSTLSSKQIQNSQTIVCLSLYISNFSWEKEISPFRKISSQIFWMISFLWWWYPCYPPS